MGKNSNHLAFVDSLRGLAALYVLIYHTALLPSPQLSVPFWAERIAMYGGSGVTLFFVVSAFTLTMTMRLRSGEEGLIKKFYIRRIFRIVPLFYVLLLITGIRDKLIFDVIHSWKVLLVNGMFIYNLIPGQQESIVWAGWTLGVEMLFYLVFPFIYRYTTDIWKSMVFLLFSMILSSIHNHLTPHYFEILNIPIGTYIYFSVFNQLPSFAVGIVVYYIYEYLHKGGVYNNNKDIAYIFLLGGLLGLAALLEGKASFLLAGLYWQAIFYSLILLGLSLHPARLFVNKLSAFFGKISFSVYLNHPTIVFLLAPVYKIIYDYAYINSLGYVISLLVTLTLVTSVSYITYRLIEIPGMQVGKRLTV